jgi:drug/metabolite transporter (DMT)-like permease
MGAITPAMTAAFAFALLGTVETWATLGTLVPVMAGIVLAAGFEPSYSAVGLAACMGAAAARALKAVLQARGGCRPAFCLVCMRCGASCHAFLGAVQKSMAAGTAEYGAHKHGTHCAAFLRRPA